MPACQCAIADCGGQQEALEVLWTEAWFGSFGSDVVDGDWLVGNGGKRDCVTNDLTSAFQHAAWQVTGMKAAVVVMKGNGLCRYKGYGHIIQINIPSMSCIGCVVLGSVFEPDGILIGWSRPFSFFCLFGTFDACMTS